MLHDNVDNKITKVKLLYHVAKQCASWAGAAAAMQYSDDFEGCDHDVKPVGQRHLKPRKPRTVQLPEESRVIRRFPWAQRSLGTAEYTSDIHLDKRDCSDHGDMSLAKAARKAASCTLQGAKYNDAFDQNVSRCRVLPNMGKRLVTNSVPEFARPLTQDEACGHQIHVVGLLPLQYFYCDKCNAYTGRRAQNLLKHCKGRSYPSRAANRLREGKHPDTGVDLDTAPRRVTRKDVGLDIWNGDPFPTDDQFRKSVDDNMVTCSAHDDCIFWSRIQFNPTRSSLDSNQDEEDPLGLGCRLG